MKSTFLTILEFTLFWAAKMMNRQISCPEPITKSEMPKPEIRPQMSVVEGTKADKMQKVGK